METETAETALAKAQSIATRLERMHKASASFHATMGKLHKAHEDDLTKAIAGIAKACGVAATYTIGGTEPTGIGTIPSGATENIRPFTSAVPPEPELSKTAPVVATPAPVAPPPVPPPDTYTKAQVDEMLTAFANDFSKSFIEALLSKGDDVEKGGNCASCGLPMDKCNCKVTKGVCPTCGKDMDNCKCASKVATGVGDRTDTAIAHEKAVRSMPVFKAMDGTLNANVQPTTPSALTPAESASLVQKAANGDRDAILTLMKGARGGDVPATLIEPLSKVH